MSALDDDLTFGELPNQNDDEDLDELLEGESFFPFCTPNQEDIEKEKALFKQQTSNPNRDALRKTTELSNMYNDLVSNEDDESTPSPIKRSLPVGTPQAKWSQEGRNESEDIWNDSPISPSGSIWASPSGSSGSLPKTSSWTSSPAPHQILSPTTSTTPTHNPFSQSPSPATTTITPTNNTSSNDHNDTKSIKLEQLFSAASNSPSTNLQSPQSFAVQSVADIEAKLANEKGVNVSSTTNAANIATSPSTSAVDANWKVKLFQQASNQPTNKHNPALMQQQIPIANQQFQNYPTNPQFQAQQPHHQQQYHQPQQQHHQQHQQQHQYQHPQHHQQYAQNQYHQRQHHQNQYNHNSNKQQNQNNRYNKNQSQRKSVWKQSKKRMKSYEIQTIIRIQEHQLCDKQYIEDYYYQVLMTKKKLRGEVIPSILPQPLQTHTPLCEITNPITKPNSKDGEDPLKGALGRVPAHSIRAPRKALDLNEEQTPPTTTATGEEEEEVYTSFLNEEYPISMAIEDSWICLLDLEDLEFILRTQQMPKSRVELLCKERDLILRAICRILEIKPENSNFPIKNELLSLLFLKHKGRKLFLRFMKVLPPSVSNLLLLFFIQELPRVLSSNVADEMELAFTVSEVVNLLRLLPFHLLVFALNLIVLSYNVVHYNIIFGNELGLLVFKGILSFGAYHCKMNKKEKEAWKSTFANFFNETSQLFAPLTQSSTSPLSLEQIDRIWDFLGVMITNSTQVQASTLVNLLKTSIMEALESNPNGAVQSLLRNNT